MEKYMKLALKEALKGLEEDEVPIGAVIVKAGKVISKAHNKRQKNKVATHHAEILAIEKACIKLGDWRLENAEIYVTLEPCPMCAGAIANGRIAKLVFGAFDQTGDNKNLLTEILTDKRLNHKVLVQGGVLEKECKSVLTDFFKSKRKNPKN